MAQSMRRASEDLEAFAVTAAYEPTLHPVANDPEAGPHCPACGFRVFNRRYPRCESCGTELPETLVYSPTERHALIQADEETAREVARQERPTNDSVFGTLDDALLDVLVSSTGR